MPGHILTDIKQEFQMLFSHVSSWHWYSLLCKAIEFCVEICECIKATVTVSKVPLGGWILSQINK